MPNSVRGKAKQCSTGKAHECWLLARVDHAELAFACAPRLNG